MSNEEVKQVVLDYINMINEKYHVGCFPCQPYYVDIKKSGSGFLVITCIGTSIIHQKVIHTECSNIDEFRNNLFAYNPGYYTNEEYEHEVKAGQELDKFVSEKCDECNKLLEAKNIKLTCAPRKQRFNSFSKTNGYMELLSEKDSYKLIEVAYYNYADTVKVLDTFNKDFVSAVNKFIIDKKTDLNYSDYYDKDLGIIVAPDGNEYDLCNPEDVAKLKDVRTYSIEPEHTIVF